MKKVIITSVLLSVIVMTVLLLSPYITDASSHREAPLISIDPLADNTDLYVFRSPDDTNMVTIVANYIPLELPEGGPNYSTFGESVHYEIHIKNQTSVGPLGTATDDITYRFTFSQQMKIQLRFSTFVLVSRILKQHTLRKRAQMVATLFSQ